MKKITFVFTFLVLLFTASEEANAQNCKPNADQVAVFTQPIYMESCTVLDLGEHLTDRRAVARLVAEKARTHANPL